MGDILLVLRSHNGIAIVVAHDAMRIRGIQRTLSRWALPPHTANASSGTNAAGIALCSRQRIAIGRSPS